MTFAILKICKIDGISCAKLVYKEQRTREGIYGVHVDGFGGKIVYVEDGKSSIIVACIAS